MKETNAGKRELIDLIQTRIALEGSIPFDDYMSLCLYHETYGYYTSDTAKVGKEGDFYTSASIGTVMGELLAAYVIKSGWGERAKSHAEAATYVEMVEWGGGGGRLAKQFLDAVQLEAPVLYEGIRYTCIEHSPYHRRLQKELCEPHMSRMRWLTEDEWLNERASSATPVFLFSNELLDAFPVKRIVCRSGQWKEIHVTAGEGGWQEVEQPASEELAAYLRKHLGGIGLEGQSAEVCLLGLGWYERVSKVLPEGSVLLSIDYGHPREELLSEYRMEGTLMCYYQHQGHSDPYVHIGEQDLTAHVNFSDYQERGEAMGFITEAFMTQKEFMLEAGILDMLQSHASLDPFDPTARRNRAIRQLLLDDGMGQLFKVLIQSKPYVV